MNWGGPPPHDPGNLLPGPTQIRYIRYGLGLCHIVGPNIKYSWEIFCLISDQDEHINGSIYANSHFMFMIGV